MTALEGVDEILALFAGEEFSYEDLEQLRALLAKLDVHKFPYLMEALLRNGRLGPQENWSVAEPIFTTWAGHDPAAALRFISRRMQAAPTLAAAMMMQVVRSPKADLALVQEGLTAIPAEGRAQMTDCYLGMLAERQGIAQAVAWLDSHPSPEAEAYVIGLWAASDVGAAFDWLQSRHPTGIPAASYAAVMAPWIEKEPAKATEWLLAQPAATAPVNVLRNAAAGWAIKSPKSLADYLNEHPQLSQKDDLVEALVMHVEDPIAALDWANQIQDSERRTSVQASRLCYLFRENPTLYAAAMASELVTPETKKTMRHYESGF
jgi:hypothetical protein